MNYFLTIAMTVPLIASTYTLDPVYAYSEPTMDLSIKEKLESKVQLQETAPGLYNPVINGLQGDKISLTVDGLRFSNSIFRSGPNQYFSWIPQEFITSIEITPTSDAVGSTLNSELGIKESKAYYQYDQYNAGSKAVVKSNFDKTSVGVKVEKTGYYNDQPHTAYNQNAIYLEHEFSSHKAKFLYSESNDIQRPDNYLQNKPYTWEKQSYILIKDEIKINGKNVLDLNYQRFFESVNDKGEKYFTQDDMYGIKYNNHISKKLDYFLSNYYEDIQNKGIKYGYNTSNTGLEYHGDLTKNSSLYFRYNLAYAYATLNGKNSDFINNAVTLQLDSSNFYARYDYGYKFPTVQNLAYSLTTEKGLELPNENLKQETSHTYTLGYKRQTKTFDYGISFYYVDIKDVIQRQLQSYQINGDNVYQNVNVGKGYMHGVSSFLSYKKKFFAAMLTIEYVYGKTDLDYFSKLTPLQLFYKMSYDNFYLKWKYAPKSYDLASKDKADVRIEDPRYDQYNNKGYNTIDIGVVYDFNAKNSLNVDFLNIFDNDGRVLGSSTDVAQRSFSVRYTYSF